MKEFVNLAEQSLKSFFKDKINRVLVVILVGFILLGWCNFKMFKQLKVNSEKITKVEKKVDFRYFNLTRSLEDIHSEGKADDAEYKKQVIDTLVNAVVLYEESITIAYNYSG